jgi:hypothetical protein
VPLPLVCAAPARRRCARCGLEPKRGHERNAKHRAERKFYPLCYFLLCPVPSGLAKTILSGGPPFDITMLSSSYTGAANDVAAAAIVVLVRPGFAAHAMNMGIDALVPSDMFNCTLRENLVAAGTLALVLLAVAYALCTVAYHVRQLLPCPWPAPTALNERRTPSISDRAVRQTNWKGQLRAKITYLNGKGPQHREEAHQDASRRAVAWIHNIRFP